MGNMCVGMCELFSNNLRDLVLDKCPFQQNDDLSAEFNFGNSLTTVETVEA